MKKNQVWVEKYRPDNFNDIVLEPFTKIILKNIIETSYFPNILLYGPPGTGKTTVIINLINAYQEKLNQKNKELMVHLNASDERGIDIIRGQINQFVNSKTLFHKGTKIVVLDEVDYMTKTAQQALRYLLQTNNNDVRYCLICNYISKIDEGLQNEFVKLRFNQLPEEDIINFLTKISIEEKLNISKQSLILIQKMYNSDIRSMINFMQSKQHIVQDNIKIIDTNVWINMFEMIKDETDLNIILTLINKISISYNIDKKYLIKGFLNYLVRNNPNFHTKTTFDFIENIMHTEDIKSKDYVTYSALRLSKILKTL